MYKFQAFCLLALTLLVFSQGNPVTNKSKVIQAVQDDVNKLRKHFANNDLYRIPLTADVTRNCSLNALACYGKMLQVLRVDQEDKSTNTIEHVIFNIQQLVKMNSSNTVALKDLCTSRQCTFRMEITKDKFIVEEFLNFLRKMNSE